MPRPEEPPRGDLLDRLSLSPRLVRLLAWGTVGIAAALPWGASALGVFEREAPEAETTVQPSARPELVWLPGGSFQMGSPAGEVGRDDDETLHTVEVGPFAMCRTEVTQGQWEAVMGSNPSDCDNGCGPDLPVQNVSWLDAVSFLNRLSEREGLAPCYRVSGEDVTWEQTCAGYRLPTEAEWEYAARAGTQTAWSWGDDAAGADTHAWFSDNAERKAHPVATRDPNPWGLFDVHGNVWEWGWDWYGDTLVNSTVDKGGPDQGQNRVLRGGSFGDGPLYLRSADRGRYTPSVRVRVNGLRCARGSRPSIDQSPP